MRIMDYVYSFCWFIFLTPRLFGLYSKMIFWQKLHAPPVKVSQVGNDWIRCCIRNLNYRPCLTWWYHKRKWSSEPNKAELHLFLVPAQTEKNLHIKSAIGTSASLIRILSFSAIFVLSAFFNIEFLNSDYWN